MARLMPFQEATIEYFCLAVNGSRGSGAVGGGGSRGPKELVALPSLEPLANFPNSQPMLKSQNARVSQGLRHHESH